MTYANRNANGDILIHVAPSITVEPAEGATSQMSLTSASGQGKVLFNNETGRVLQSQLDLTMTMTMTINGQSFDQKVHQTTSMKLLE